MKEKLKCYYDTFRGPPNYTPFDEKFNELHFLKYRTKMHVKKLNSLKYNYVEWFSKKCQSFLDCVKLTQILAAKLVPNDIENMQDFKKIHDMSRRFPRNGTPRDSNPAKMDDFSMFWQEMVTLKEETDDLYESLCRYCDSVTRLRQPSIKPEIDRLKAQLDEAYSEDYKFTDLKNERENLFVYKVAPYDYRYHGLLGYIPYLLTLTLKLTTWLSKIHLEKE